MPFSWKNRAQHFIQNVTKGNAIFLNTEGSTFCSDYCQRYAIFLDTEGSTFHSDCCQRQCHFPRNRGLNTLLRLLPKATQIFQIQRAQNFTKTVAKDNAISLAIEGSTFHSDYCQRQCHFPRIEGSTFYSEDCCQKQCHFPRYRGLNISFRLLPKTTPFS